MKLLIRMLISILLVTMLFICLSPKEWKRWLVLGACVSLVFLSIIGVILLMGVKFI